MATFSMDMPPQMQGDKDDARLLRQYVARLVDRLLYTLNHLDSENITRGGITAENFAGGKVGIASAAVSQMKLSQMGTAEIQHLTAQVAEIVTAVIKTAVVDWASLKHMVGDTAIISRFVGEDMYIDHLAVTAAQAVELWAGTLCIKAADGNFYRMTVDLDTGLVTATAVTVTQAEYDAGITSGGQHIIESDLTVEELNARSINAVEALISKIIAQRIDVDELFAREATIQTLTTGTIASALGQGLDLSSNESIQATVRSLIGESDSQVLSRLTQVELKADAASVSVQDLDNRLGTHFIVENDRIRITQDQTKDWEQQLTATELRFINKRTNAVAARFGSAGGYADRLQSYKKLCVGSDSGWYDMSERAGSVDDKWRGTSANAAAVITRQPQTAIVDVNDSVFTFSLTAENTSVYQWQQRARKAGEEWTDIYNENGHDYEGVVTTETLAKEYRCIAGGATSDTVRVRVKGAPVILLAEVSGSTITLTAAGTVSTWTWQKWVTSAWSPVTGSGNSLTVSGAGDYRCVLEDADGGQCVSDVFTMEG